MNLTLYIITVCLRRQRRKAISQLSSKLRMLENKETTSPVQIKIVTSKIILETKTEIAEPVNQYFFRFKKVCY